MCSAIRSCDHCKLTRPAHESLRLSPCRRRLEDKRSGFQKTYEKTSPQTRSRYYDAARRCLHLLNARVQFRCRFRNPVHRSGSPFRYSFTLPKPHTTSLTPYDVSRLERTRIAIHLFTPPDARTRSEAVFSHRTRPGQALRTGPSPVPHSPSRILPHVSPSHSYLRLPAHLFRSTS